MIVEYGTYDKIFADRWNSQTPLQDLHISREEIDMHIEKAKDSLKTYMDKNNLIGLQLFKNVFIVNDVGYGAVCERCNSSLLVIHYDSDSLYKLFDMNTVVWLPSLESFAKCSFRLGDNHVVPIISRALKSKEVSYRCLDCDNGKWYYLEYDSIFGLEYGKEEVACFANNENVEKRGYKSITPEDLERDYPEGSILTCSEDKSNIENLDMDYIYSMIDSLLKVDKSKTFTLLFTLSGYDRDSRELWEIDEVKSYITKLLEEKPEFLWFIELKLPWILCYCAKESNYIGNGQVGISIDSDKLLELSKRTMQALKNNSFFDASDIKKYMIEFNEAVNRDVYYI